MSNSATISLEPNNVLEWNFAWSKSVNGEKKYCKNYCWKFIKRPLIGKFPDFLIR